MIYYIIIIALIIIFTVIGACRGIARTLLNLAAMVINVIITNYLSGVIAQWIYAAFVQQTVISNLETAINQNGASYAIANCFRAVPDWLSAMTGIFYGIFGLSLEDVQNSISVNDYQSASLAQSIEQPLGEIAVSVLSIVLAAVIFLIFVFLFKLVIRALLKFFKIPVIKQINAILGGILGAAEGIAFVWIIFYGWFVFGGLQPIFEI